jgi:hypothetical protein
MTSAGCRVKTRRHHQWMARIWRIYFTGAMISRSIEHVAAV